MFFPDKVKTFLQKLTYAIKIFAIYWFNIFLVIALAVCFWSLPQGVDVLTKTAELHHWYSRDIVLLALFFYAFVVWYSSRAISWEHANVPAGEFTQAVFTHLPRLMGYFVYVFFYISYLNSPMIFSSGIGPTEFYLLVLFFLLLYFLMAKIFAWYSAKPPHITAYKIIWRLTVVLILFGGLLPSKICFLVSIPWLMVSFVYLVVNRKYFFATLPPQKLLSVIRKIFDHWHLQIDVHENMLFSVFNLVSFIALCVYIFAAFDLRFAIELGPAPIVLLSLAIIGGAINLLKMFSYIFQIHLTFFLLVLMFIGGIIFRSQSHKISLETLPNTNDTPFSKRQDFYTYLNNWINQRKYAFSKDSIVPMIFILADGGASRSGYWTASVLGKLEDETKDSLSKYLFCLSGASGGSVGNATFFSLLYLRTNPSFSNHQMKDGQMVKYAQEYLQTDFLSYTLARMLGPGCVINAIVPVIPDRAAALQDGLNYGADTSTLLSGFFANGFSKMITTRNDTNYQLPILCINTTQMEDASPGVICNINLHSITQRTDVLDLIQPGFDISLSSAVITGARFPYVTPAGLIVQKKNEATGTKYFYHYFVDGGYFDNSGAGIVQEMIQKIEAFKKDNLQNRDLKKLRYIIIHISNSADNEEKFSPVHPFKNDLASPLVTLLGSYSKQTDVNDSRLQDYVTELYKTDTFFHHYGLEPFRRINLYRTDTLEKTINAPPEYYPMSWSISDTVLRSMNERLKDQAVLATVVYGLKDLFESK